MRSWWFFFARVYHHGAVVRQEMRRSTFHDPVTGDPLSFGEEVSWLLQGVIRRWSVFMLITAFTVWAWTAGHIWDQGLTDMWNLFASYWAMALETIVGIAMFSQTRRDAVKIRQIYRFQEETAARLEEVTALLRGGRHAADNGFSPGPHRVREVQ